MSVSRISARVLAAPLAALILACAGLAAQPPRALASHSQFVTFEEPRDLLNPSTRDATLAKLASLGVRSLRVVMYWRDVAPAANSSHRPNFDATDPTNYAWGQYDALLAAAQQRGWRVILTVSGPVPKWATAARRDNLTRPGPLAFQDFMKAVGRHFGSEVSLFSIWNEPNHPAYLRPQFNSDGSPASPRIYRALFQAGYQGLVLSGIKSPKVLMGETAPTGYTTAHGLHDVAPLAFLRGALCLSASYRMSRTCSTLPAYGYAHHAYTIPVGPFFVPTAPDDVTIGVLSRLVRALDRAARAHAIKPHMSIYLTEFGVQSLPNQFLGVRVDKQAEFDAISERIAYDNPRVAAFSQYLLRDDPLGGRPGASVHGGTIGFQTGLEYISGKHKPLYEGWRLPLVVSRRGRGVALWGLVRPATGPTKVDVLVQRPRSSRYVTLARGVRTDRLGYWHLNSSSPGSHWRVRWTAPHGTVYTGPAIRAY